MMMNDRKETLYRVFRTTLGIDRVDDTLSQRSCEQWDSLAHLNLIVALEEAFGLSSARPAERRLPCCAATCRTSLLPVPDCPEPAVFFMLRKSCKVAACKVAACKVAACKVAACKVAA